jgi:predicted RNase H-like HicB family nuclease
MPGILGYTGFAEPLRGTGEEESPMRADAAEAAGRSLLIELEREEDGRWIAEVPSIPGVMVYGESRNEAIQGVKALALRVIADRLEHGEPVPEVTDIFSVV